MTQVPAINPEMFRPFLEYLTLGIDVAAGVVIAISIVRGFIMYVKILRRSPIEQTKEEEGIKRFVGNGLILALDIEVGSDIIKSILYWILVHSNPSRLICMKMIVVR